MTVFEIDARAELPHIDQMTEYHELMQETAHARGHGARSCVRFVQDGDKLIPHFVGMEAYMLGDLTEWSHPNRDGVTHVERDRRYTGSYRRLGYSAHRLCVLESDSVRVPCEQGDMYETLRGMYRFEWDDIVGVYLSDARRFMIRSMAAVDAEVLPRYEFDATDRLVLNPERTGDVERTDTGWIPATMSDVDQLLYRTHDYRVALLAS